MGERIQGMMGLVGGLGDNGTVQRWQGHAMDLKMRYSEMRGREGGRTEQKSGTNTKIEKEGTDHSRPPGKPLDFRKNQLAFFELLNLRLHAAVLLVACHGRGYGAASAVPIESK